MNLKITQIGYMGGRGNEVFWVVGRRMLSLSVENPNIKMTLGKNVNL
jgi:hypothetical protein